jgi:hypothetical protein
MQLACYAPKGKNDVLQHVSAQAPSGSAKWTPPECEPMTRRSKAVAFCMLLLWR